MRKQAAVFVLKGKNLTLDGIDLIVDVRDLSRTQTALFLCTGANLTLRNCSITILNQARALPLSLFRTETGPTRAATHVRLERCLVRGAFTRGLPTRAAARASVVLRDSVILGRRRAGLFASMGADAAPECRIFLVQSLVAGPGPIIDWTKKAAGGASKPLVDPRVRLGVRPPAWGGHRQRDLLRTIRLNRPASKSTGSGEENLFAGWMGFFACGDDQTVTVTDLAAARSTWNGTDRSSREILAPWAHAGDLAGAMPADFRSFVPSHLAILQCAARPRGGLYEKAVAAYGDPAVPEPTDGRSRAPSSR